MTHAHVSLIGELCFFTSTAEKKLVLLFSCLLRMQIIKWGRGYGTALHRWLQLTSAQLQSCEAITKRHMPPGGHCSCCYLPVCIYRQTICCCILNLTGVMFFLFFLQDTTGGFINRERSSVPVAPRGWPLEMSPPLGFTTNLPPYVLSPRSIRSPALPAEVGKLN